MTIKTWGKGVAELRELDYDKHHKIGYILVEWKKEAKLNKNIVTFSKRITNGTLLIFTTHPVTLMGEKGELLKKYTRKLKEVEPLIEKVSFIETSTFVVY